MQFDTDLMAALASVEHEFGPNELAYLALTCKIELPIRDRLAFMLHRRYQGSHYLVAREWKRVDLAVLDGEAYPAYLVELKAMYTFDAAADAGRYAKMTVADEGKAFALARADTQVYSLLLATHVHGVVPERLFDVVKYAAGINTSVRRHQSADHVRERAIAEVAKEHDGRILVNHKELIAGSAFGLDVSVFCWLIRFDNAEMAALSPPLQS